MDLMEDALVDGSKLRVLTAIDLYSRECVALLASKHFTGADVADVLDAARATRRAFPKSMRVDNGTEFTSKALDQWAYLRGVRPISRGPASPWTTRSSKPSTVAFDETVYRNTGSSISRMRSGPSMPGRRTTTNTGRTVLWVTCRPPNSRSAVGLSWIESSLKSSGSNGPRLGRTAVQLALSCGLGLARRSGYTHIRLRVTLVI